MGDDEKRPPPVMWAERKNLVYIFIHVTDCKLPEIKLNQDSLSFKGKDGLGSLFEVKLNLFKNVNTETSMYSVKDRGIDFILYKAEQDEFWNRLLKEKVKYHWLRVDFSKWKDDDDSDVEEDPLEFEEMMKQMSGLKATTNDLNDLDSAEGEE